MSDYTPRPQDLHHRKPSWMDKDIVIEPRLPSLQPVISAFNSVSLALRSGRRRANWLAFIPVLILLFIIFPARPPFPPSYAVEWGLEKYLPQVDPRAEPPEGKDGRYLMFEPIKETGFNFQLQSLILQQHVAFMSNRSLAYQPYHVVDSIFPVSIWRWPWVSSRIPMSALLYSISNGFEALYGIPRAVPVRYFDRVCARPESRHVNFRSLLLGISQDRPSAAGIGKGKAEHVHVDVGGVDEMDGAARLEEMIRIIGEESSGRCLIVDENPFDRAFFETPAPIDFYPTLASSPVLKHFSFSPRVLSVINRSLHLLSPKATPYEMYPEVEKRVIRKGPWKNLLALHLRKGRKGYCEDLGERLAPFVGFNKLPALPGNENVPPSPSMVYATRMGLYRAKCDPNTLEIIARARRLRANHPLLDTIYILSNEDSEWLEETRKWLLSEGWMQVITSLDLYTWEDAEIAESVDTEIARRAGVYVADGFSTMASNIALLRTAVDRKPTDYTQFW